MNNVIWILKKFEELTPDELYAILQLRNEVFAVEQNCVYYDMDDRDQASLHFMGWLETKLVAYTRIIPPGIVYEDPSIGRVVTSKHVRRTGIGRDIMNRSIDIVYQIYSKIPIRISAQLYLKQFYNELGFEVTGDPYIEDSIYHIEMVRP